VATLISLRKRPVGGSNGLTKPRSDCCIHVNCELPCAKVRDLNCITSQVRVGSVREEQVHVLGVGPSTRQPLFALDLLPTENHARTGTVPVDGGNLGVVPQRKQFRAALVARDGVEWPASRVYYGCIDDLVAAARDLELDRGSFVGARWFDQCGTQGGWRGRRPTMAVCGWVSASKYLGGVDG
jgi:hypothetical protein